MMEEENIATLSPTNGAENLLQQKVTPEGDEAATVESSSRRRPFPVDFDAQGDGEFDEDEMETDGVSEKKRRMPAGEDIGPRLVKMIKKLDEDLQGNTLESALDTLAHTLEENMDPYEGQIIDIFYECVAFLPEKITVFSTLLGIMNARSPEFGKNCIQRLVTELNACFAEEKYDIAVRIITFLTDLGNSRVITMHSVFALLESLFELVAGENNKSDYLIWCVLHTMPWIGPELNDVMPAKLQELLANVRKFLDSRKKPHMKMLQVWTDQTPTNVQEDYLDGLWAQLMKLQEDQWIERHILRPYVSFKSMFTDAEQHNLSGVDYEAIRTSQNHPVPRVIFRLFDPSDSMAEEPAMPSAGTIERFLVEEDLNWIIDNNYTDWKLCAKTLLAYHRRETVPLNYCIIEVVFGQLFHLPKPPHMELFYGALLIELCRLQANSMPQVLAQATELLYQRVDTMQPICLDRFVDWFSYHLSNFEYRWSWIDWADCLKLDSLHFRRIFVREVVEKCLRFSFHKKLTEFLPPEFDEIIPEEPGYCYLLENPDHPAYEQAQYFLSLIRNRASDDEVLMEMRKQRPPLSKKEQSEKAANGDEGEMQDEEENGNKKEEVVEATGDDEIKPEEEPSEVSYSPEAVAVFTSVLFKMAATTITHSFVAITRYRQTFLTITNGNPEIQVTILRTLYDSWSTHKQMMTLLVDKLVRIGILEASVVVAWVFCDDMKREFKRSWVWEVLNSALQRLSNRTAEAGSSQQQLEEAKRSAFLDICHKFTLILTEHLLNCESDGTDVETDFYNYVMGRFRSIFLHHFSTMRYLAEDLDRELFSSTTIEPRIRAVFTEFQAILN